MLKKRTCRVKLFRVQGSHRGFIYASGIWHSIWDLAQHQGAPLMAGGTAHAGPVRRRRLRVRGDGLAAGAADAADAGAAEWRPERHQALHHARLLRLPLRERLRVRCHLEIQGF